jgi:hypothetical protein
LEVTHHNECGPAKDDQHPNAAVEALIKQPFVSGWTINATFATTKPSPKRALPVRSHAR